MSRIAAVSKMYQYSIEPVLWWSFLLLVRLRAEISSHVEEFGVFDSIGYFAHVASLHIKSKPFEMDGHGHWKFSDSHLLASIHLLLTPIYTHMSVIHLNIQSYIYKTYPEHLYLLSGSLPPILSILMYRLRACSRECAWWISTLKSRSASYVLDRWLQLKQRTCDWIRPPKMPCNMVDSSTLGGTLL